MKKDTDIRPISATLYFLPVKTRVPLKFGPESYTSATCARVKMGVTKNDGQTVYGWGETPLNVQWVWPSQLPYTERHEVLKEFCLRLAKAWGVFEYFGHAMEIGHAFQKQVLPGLLLDVNQARGDSEPIPWLAALVCCSAFDIALHDAYGMANHKPIYQTYAPPYMEKDLSYYLQPAEGSKVDFKGLYPNDFFVDQPPTHIPVWHLVGGLDPISHDELTGDEPDDGYPVLLPDWIKRDGLNCLKVKLRGTDYDWDYQRLVRVGEVAISNQVDWLSTDFNCRVLDPAYVNSILDQLVIEYPRIYGKILYVEQPFPYELEKYNIDVHSVSARKPLFMDESAHDWEHIRLGRSLGWTGVAMKTCKTQTGALLSLCWAKAHGMTLMVQDLTNPKLAQIPHVLLAAHAGTIMGVESNGMQFYPEASNAEAAIHPGLYRRRYGQLDLSTISGPGFGYRLAEIKGELPEPEAIDFDRS